MRPVLHLLGQCELTLDDAPVPFQISRKHWTVFALVATSKDCHINRKDLTETVWPLSDEKSRSVLLHNWRRSLVAASTDVFPAVPVIITEHDVSIITKDIDIDYQECCSLAKIALASHDARAVLEAGTSFDALAEDKMLLPTFTAEFVELREHFDKQRKAVLRRTLQAEAHLNPDSPAETSGFEIRLRRLGDENAIGTPAIPFKALADQSKVPTQRGIALSAASQLAASVLMAGILTAPIVLGSLSTPRKPPAPVILGTKVNKPISDLSRRLMYQLSDPDIKNSAATAICITPKNLIIAAGNAILKNGDHQTILVMLAKTGKARWVTKLTDDKGIQTTPKQLFTSESGRIYVASELIAERNNTRKLAPGCYLAVSVFDRDGQRIFERVHPETVEPNALNPIRLVTDLKGGIHAFAVAARSQASIALHVPAGPTTSQPSPLTGYPNTFRITDATSDGNSHLFLIGYLPVKTSAGVRQDWHIQAMDKASKTLWSRDIAGAVGRESAPVHGVINPQGELVAYGPLPSPKKQNGGRKVASMVTFAPSNGDIVLRDCYDSENQNPNFALSCLAIGKSAVMAVTKQSSDGSEPLTIHRIGNAASDTALTLLVRFPNATRVDDIVSFFFDGNGFLTALLRPSDDKSALTYMSMFFGRELSTGNLSATVPYAYNTHGGGLIAGHYNNMFCVYNFTKLQ